MTPTKFRGRSRQTGAWLYGDIVRHQDGRVAIVPPLRDTEIDFRQWEVRPATIGQYTGMKDTHGAEIYEGDVVTNGKHTGIVKWMPGKCCYQISPGGVFLSRQCEVQPRQ